MSDKTYTYTISEQAYANKKAYIQSYMKEKYDVISIRVPKGDRERYKELAKARGLSLTQFFIQSVEANI